MILPARITKLNKTTSTTNAKYLHLFRSSFSVIFFPVCTIGVRVFKVMIHFKEVESSVVGLSSIDVVTARVL